MHQQTPAPDSTALILIDFQTWIVQRFAPRLGPIAARAAGEAARRHRSQGQSVIHVQHLPEGFSHGDPKQTASMDFLAEVRPEVGEPVITKHSRSAFNGTTLHRHLTGLGASRIALCGLVTEGGILHTAIDARRLGYPVDLLMPGIASATRLSGSLALTRIAKLGARLVDEDLSAAD